MQYAAAIPQPISKPILPCNEISFVDISPLAIFGTTRSKIGRSIARQKVARLRNWRNYASRFNGTSTWGSDLRKTRFASARTADSRDDLVRSDSLSRRGEGIVRLTEKLAVIAITATMRQVGPGVETGFCFFFTQHPVKYL